MSFACLQNRMKTKERILTCSHSKCVACVLLFLFVLDAYKHRINSLSRTHRCVITLLGWWDSTWNVWKRQTHCRHISVRGSFYYVPAAFGNTRLLYTHCVEHTHIRIAGVRVRSVAASAYVYHDNKYAITSRRIQNNMNLCRSSRCQPFSWRDWYIKCVYGEREEKLSKSFAFYLFACAPSLNRFWVELFWCDTFEISLFERACSSGLTIVFLCNIFFSVIF